MMTITIMITERADMYGECDMATKKMILSRIMKSVKVKRDYEIEIDFAIDFEQVGGLTHHHAAS